MLLSLVLQKCNNNKSDNDDDDDDAVTMCAADLRLEVLSPLVEVDLLVVVDVGRLERLLDVDDLVPLQVQFVQHLLVALQIQHPVNNRTGDVAKCAQFVSVYRTCIW